ncbi:peroxisomal membrane protein 2-like [Chenopodium quinoa]|uniref:peroxisomal membrane protein 2-like n=1 Tax=Chenopodium quinoa TaxID=63459 RepID=UPI000B7727A1|nr:peroxisomal membrane protein 2-like [Chenopodium quinoa]
MASLRTISAQSLPPLTKPNKPTKTQKLPSLLSLPTTSRRSSVVRAAVTGDVSAVETSVVVGQLTLEGLDGGGGGESGNGGGGEGNGGGQDLNKLIDRIINATIVLAAGTYAVTKLVTIDHDYWHGWTVYEILRYAPQHNWIAYEAILKTNPVLAKMVISGVVYSIGDWIAQCYEGKPLFDFDRARMVRSGLVGFAFHGSLSHYYYEICEAVFPVRDWWAIPVKAAFDQTVWTGIWNTIYLVSLGLMRLESPANIYKELKATFWPLLTTGWKLWPFAHIVTYGVIPVEQRLLWVDCVELIWVTILSTYINDSKEARIAEESVEATISSPSEE